MKRNKEMATRIMIVYEKLDILERGASDANIDLDIGFCDLMDIALDIIGIPQDNTIEYSDEIYASTTWPEGAFCRDYATHTWDECEGAEDFIEKMIEWKREIDSNEKGTE